MQRAERLRRFGAPDVARLVDRVPPRVRAAAADARIVVGLLAIAQWACVLVFALTATHNGWLYYQGGDQTWHYTGAWLLAHGELPPTLVGYGWSVILAPIALVAGPSFLEALPAIVLLEVLVLLPIALVCVYGIAAAIAGRAFGYFAAALWVALPYVAIPLFDDRYHDRYVDQTVVQLVGLSGLSDFVSLVAVLAAGYLTVLALQRGDMVSAALAGLVAGYAIGIKPANALFVVAPILALAVARRWRGGGAFLVALLPALVTLALWKHRGLGHLPAFALEETRLAAGALAAGSSAVAAFGPLDRYVALDWGELVQNYRELREFFWSAPLVIWLPIAGFVAALRRAPAIATLLGAWVAAYLVGKGTSPVADLEGGSFFRLLLPSYPAFVLLVACAPLVVPLARLGRVRGKTPPPLRRSRALAGAAAAALVAVPLALVALPTAMEEPHAVIDTNGGVFVPVVDDLAPRVATTGGDVLIRWNRYGAGSADPVYRVFRSSGEIVQCERSEGAAAQCRLTGEFVGATGATEFQYQEPPGAWTYVVGVAADYTRDADEGDILVVSAPTPPH